MADTPLCVPFRVTAWWLGINQILLGHKFAQKCILKQSYEKKHGNDFIQTTFPVQLWKNNEWEIFNHSLETLLINSIDVTESQIFLRKTTYQLFLIKTEGKTIFLIYFRLLGPYFSFCLLKEIYISFCFIKAR